MRNGFKWNASAGAAVIYEKEKSPALQWEQFRDVSPLEWTPIIVGAGGTAEAKISLVPQLDVRLFKVAGFYVNLEPRAEASITGNAGFSFSPSSGNWTITPTGQAEITFGRFIDLNAGLSIMGVNQDVLPAMEPIRLYTSGIDERKFPKPATLEFINPTSPQNVSVARGGTLILEGNASGGEGAIFYQWYHNGMLLPGQTSRQLMISNMLAGNAGNYLLRARAGAESVFSVPFTVTITNAVNADGEFSLIPAGAFTMGNTSGDIDISDAPPVTVNVSAFYIGKYEVTQALWDEVREWGELNGYTDFITTYGMRANHPVSGISWYNMVKWCNARSEKEGLTPVYTVNDAVMKTGHEDPTANWSANGYRLPTEAEWEKAARGGVRGRRFPWGDTISHSQANYAAISLFSYDLSGSQSGHLHPTYYNTTSTAPVGSFAPNGYGLYDMSGNRWEFCWDYYGASTYVNGATNPRGATLGSYRVIRGGSYMHFAILCRAAARHYDVPDLSMWFGFRLARSSVP